MEANSLILEILVLGIIFYRVYVLQKFNIDSASDKIFVIYYLKNNEPLVGYTVLFYIPIIFLLELFLIAKVDLALLILATMEIFIKYKHIFTDLKTTNQDLFLDNLIKKSFSTLTKNEYIQIKEKLEEKAPFWKLYMTELMVFIFAIWTIELGGGVG
jgi:hypothetical protein